MVNRILYWTTRTSTHEGTFCVLVKCSCLILLKNVLLIWHSLLLKFCSSSLLFSLTLQLWSSAQHLSYDLCLRISYLHNRHPHPPNPTIPVLFVDLTYCCLQCQLANNPPQSLCYYWTALHSASLLLGLIFK